jgi:1-aminocyclopropane-1-carboxylate deaminase
VSVAFDGTRVYYTNFNGNTLFSVLPDGTAPLAVPIVGAAGGINAFFYDASRDMFWAAGGSTGRDIYLLDQTGIAVLQFVITNTPGNCDNGFGCLALAIEAPERVHRLAVFNSAGLGTELALAFRLGSVPVLGRVLLQPNRFLHDRFFDLCEVECPDLPDAPHFKQYSYDVTANDGHADALARGCDTLVSIGGVQSNHTRQVAATAARLGMGCVLVQESWVDWPDAVYDRVGNILLSRLMGADVRLEKAGFGIGFKESWERAIREIEETGGTPYAIPAGASDHRLGGLGYANWAREVAQQERDLGVFFDTVVVCSVTGSTQAGMVAGFAALEEDRPRRVIGIDGSAKPKETLEQVARIARSTAELIGAREPGDEDIILDDRYHAGVYGIPDGQTLDAMRVAARLEGMITDPVYEGKSMAGMLDLVTSREIPKDSTVLYAHLGGQPALSAYSALFS